jgi:hypothetical protein
MANLIEMTGVLTVGKDYIFTKCEWIYTYIDGCNHYSLQHWPCFLKNRNFMSRFIETGVPLDFRISKKKKEQIHKKLHWFHILDGSYDVSSRVAEPEPEPEPVGTVFIWGLRHRNRIRNTAPVPGTKK